MFVLKKPAIGLDSQNLQLLFGKVATRDIENGDLIQPDDFLQ